MPQQISLTASALLQRSGNLEADVCSTPTIYLQLYNQSYLRTVLPSTQNTNHNIFVNVSSLITHHSSLTSHVVVRWSSWSRRTTCEGIQDLRQPNAIFRRVRVLLSLLRRTIQARSEAWSDEASRIAEKWPGPREVAGGARARPWVSRREANFQQAYLPQIPKLDWYSISDSTFRTQHRFDYLSERVEDTDTKVSKC